MSDDDKKREEETIYGKLRRLFQSGPIVKRKVRAYKQPTSTTAYDIFKKNVGKTYSNAMSSYGQYDRLCVDLHTKIAVPEACGFKTLKELIELYPDGEKFIVYAYDHAKKGITPAWAHHPRSSGIKQTVKVTFDDGSHLICTPDHPCMLRDGTYKDAGELKSGDSMMPFYRRVNKKGYRTLNLNHGKRGSHPKEHTVIATWFAGNGLTRDECVHHKDFNPSNNTPENLQIMTKEAHGKLHLDITNQFWLNQENIKKIRDASKRSWKEHYNDRVASIREGRWSKEQCVEFSDYMTELMKTSEGAERIKKFTHYWSGRQRPQEWKDARTGHLHHSFIPLDEQSLTAAIVELKQRKLVAERLNTSPNTVLRRAKEIFEASTWNEIVEKCQASMQNNHKVVSVEPHEVIEVGDLTVDGYENFATDTIVVHNSRYSDFQEMQYTPEISTALDIFCLTGDNRIPLLDGRILTIKELYDLSAKNFNVYSYDIAQSKYVPGLCSGVKLTGKNQPIVRVTFDDGTYIRVTKEHRVLLHNGEYVEAGHLKFGDSVRSVTKRISSTDNGDIINGYEMIRLDNGTWKYTHRIVASHVDPHGKGVVHHINHLKRDNSPDNLVIMSRKEHQEVHRRENNIRWRNNAEYATKMSRIFSEHCKKMHAQPGWTQNVFIKRRNEVFAQYTQEERNEKFGRKGKQNGMYGSARYAEKNPRWNAEFKREFTKEEIIELIFSGETLDNAVEHIPTRKIILTEHCKKFGIVKWAKNAVLRAFPEMTSDIIRMLRVHASKDNLRNFGKICNKIGITRSEGYAALYANNYKDWSDFVNTNNHKVVSVTEDGTEDVYDLTVDEYHNFAVSIGSDDSFVIVHNSEETTSGDDKNQVLHIYSENRQIKRILEELFYDTLNVEFNLTPWVRNLCAFGDQFLYVDFNPEYGVLNALPMPVNEVEREEGYDPKDPLAVRFRWVTQGNAVLENWQVIHFRLLGNDAFLPYGSSVLEPARRVWRQLILLEDSMLVYRIIRSPERRVFYIDVGNIPPEEIPNYMEQARTQLRSSQIIDKNAGRVDLRYNPLCLSLNTVIPLQNGQNLALKDIISEFAAGKELWTYSLDLEKRQTVPGKIVWAGVTRRDAEVVKITLDDNTTMTVTPDHRVMLRDGTYKRADELVADEALMPLDREESKQILIGSNFLRVPSRAEDRKVASVEKVAEIQDTGCVTVEPYHNFAILTDANENEITAGSNPQQKSGIYVHNSSDEDYFIPTRGGESGSRIESLPGGVNTTAIDDVIYIQSKLFSALKIPKAFLGFDDSIGSKATLCVRGDTRLPLLDGRVVTIRELADNWDVESKRVAKWEDGLGTRGVESTLPELYSYDHETQQIVPGKVKWCKPTRLSREEAIVTLDDGNKVHCTPDHLFMLRDGTYREARDLTSGTSLMPFYQRISNVEMGDYLDGYHMHVEPKSGKWRYTHRNAGKKKFGTLTSSNVVHHVNFDKCNNHSSNLFFFRRGVEHQNYHADLNRRCKKFKGKGNPRFVKGWTLARLIEHAKSAATKEEVIQKSGCTKRVFQRLLIDAGMSYQEFADRYMPLATSSRRCIGYGEVPLDDIVSAARKGRTSTETASLLGITRIVLRCRLRDYGYSSWRQFKHDVVWETTRELLQQRFIECGNCTRMYEKYYTDLLSKSAFFQRVRDHFGDAKQIVKNHKVASVQVITLPEAEQFYDLEIEGYHNFAIVTGDEKVAGSNVLPSGIFIHNSQEDIRFSRTINRIQRVVISELNKLAVIHLYANGFEGDDLLDFHLQLSNPSTVAQQQKLEIYRTKLEIAGSAPDGLVDKTWIRKNILNLTDDEIERIDRGRLEDKTTDMKIEKATGASADSGMGGGGAGGGGGAPFVGMDSDMTAGLDSEEGEGGEGPGGDAGSPGGPEGGEGEGGEAPEVPPNSGGEEDEEDRKLFSAHVSLGDLLDEDDVLPDYKSSSQTSRGAPIKPLARVKMESLLSSIPTHRSKPRQLTEGDIEELTSELDEADVVDKEQGEFTQQQRLKHNRSRLRHSGKLATATVDHKRMVSHERPGDSLTDPYDTHKVNQADPFKEAAQRSVNRFLAKSANAQMKTELDVSSLVKSLSESMRNKSNDSKDDDVELEFDNEFDDTEDVNPKKRDL